MTVGEKIFLRFDDFFTAIVRITLGSEGKASSRPPVLFAVGVVGERRKRVRGARWKGERSLGEQRSMGKETYNLEWYVNGM